MIRIEFLSKIAKSVPPGRREYTLSTARLVGVGMCVTVIERRYEYKLLVMSLGMWGIMSARVDVNKYVRVNKQGCVEV